MWAESNNASKTRITPDEGRSSQELDHAQAHASAYFHMECATANLRSKSSPAAVGGVGIQASPVGQRPPDNRRRLEN